MWELIAEKSELIESHTRKSIINSNSVKSLSYMGFYIFMPIALYTVSLPLSWRERIQIQFIHTTLTYVAAEFID